MILVDERRLAYGIDPVLVRIAGGDSESVLSPAAFLARGSALHVLREGERRAMVRRIAATREELAIPAHVRRSASFAALALAAIDRDEDDAFGGLGLEYRTLLAFVNAVDAGTALRHVLGGGTFSADVTTLLDRRAVAGRRRRIHLAAFSGAGRIRARTGRPRADRGPGTRSGRRARAVCVSAFCGVGERCRCTGGAALEARADRARRRAHAARRRGRGRERPRCLGPGALRRGSGQAAGGGREFAHALRTIARAYRVPDAGASDVVAAAAAILRPDAATFAALERIARDFDAARILAPAWEAADAIDEFEAELAGCTQRTSDFPIFPAPAVAAEPALPVTSRRATFSASALNAFAECERKWFYRYVCAAVEDRGSSASFYGIAFHAALEEFHGTHARFDGGDPATLGSFLDYCIVTAFDRHRTRFDAPVEFELQKRRARRTAKRYLTWLLERARKAPFEVIGCETSTDVKLGDYSFIGYIDRLDRDDATGAVTVVDYKTGAIAKSAGEYLTDVLAFREFQLPFYYWARTAAGDTVTRLSLVPLKDALLDVEPIELTVVAQRPRQSGRQRNGTTAAIGVIDLERARQRMIEIAATLATPTIARYAVATDPDACRYCAYKDACRERPAVAEERFGR